MQLKEILRLALTRLNVRIDIFKLRTGTIHGICNELIQEFLSKTHLGKNYEVLEELTQYLFLYEHFKEIFEVMHGLPVTIRLLDPPMHEFMPEDEEKINMLAKSMHVTPKELEEDIKGLHEVNPMLGHRGCRLGITYPEIYEMQIEAIFLAANQVTLQGIKALPEIQIPLVSDVSEIREVKKSIEVVKERLKDKINFSYKVGTMVELPRACLTANKLANEVEFISFGTNDLTQTTYGLSRDDGGKFLFYYLDNNIFEFNPTETVDQEGVGALMKICVNLARCAKQNIDFGICGEHGGDPNSVEFCHEIGLNYVSCSPVRVPIARLAAAQAAIKQLKKKPFVAEKRTHRGIKKRREKSKTEKFH